MISERIRGHARGIGGAVLLTILAACGYLGSMEERVQTVSVAVTRQSYALEDTSADTAQDAAARLKLERENELELLERVASDEGTESSTRQDALAQMADIARRMEVEAQAVACLDGMGFDGAKAVYGAQMITLLIPYEHITTEADKTRALDAVSGLTGLEPADIKIILTKK